MALGSGAYTQSRLSVAIGNDAVAGAAGGEGLSVAVGVSATANNQKGVAIGYASSAGAGDTAIGYQSYSNDGAVALGMGARATHDSTVLGRSAGMATNARAVTSVGYMTQNLQSAHESYSYGMVSIGDRAQAKGNESIAIGKFSNASEEQSIAIGGYVIAPRSGMVIGAAADNSILSGQFNDTSAATNGYLLTSTRFGINRTSTPDAMLDVTSFANTDVGVIVQGAASQTADLQQWQNSAGTTLASIAPSLNTTDRMTLMVSGTIVSNPSDADRIGVVSIGSGAYAMGNEATAIGTNTRATTRSLALGASSIATDSTSIAIGYNCHAKASKSISIGNLCVAQGERSIAMGDSSSDNGNSYSLAMGWNCNARGTQSVALGASAEAGTDSTAVGSYAKALGTYSVIIGRSISTSVNSGLVIGAGSNNHILSGQFNDTFDAVNGHLNILGDSLKVSGNGQVRVNDAYTFPTAVAGGSDYVLTAQTDGSTAWAAAAGGSPGGSDTYVQFNDGGSFGGESEFTYSKAGSGILKVGTIVNSVADDSTMVSIGSGALSKGNANTITIGKGAESEGAVSMAIGIDAKAQAYDIAIGNGALARGGDFNAVAIGYNASATVRRGVAIGPASDADANQCTAIGSDTFAGIYGSTALGYYARAAGNTSLAIGDSSQVEAGANFSIVIGDSANASASCTNAIVLGSKAHAVGSYGIAIGDNVYAPTSGLVIGAASDNSCLLYTSPSPRD